MRGIVRYPDTSRPPQPGTTTLSDDVGMSYQAASLQRGIVPKEVLSYDLSGKISKKTISGMGYSYTYDTRGRLVKATAEGGEDFSAEYGYDDRNNLISLKRNGVIDKTGTASVYGELDNLVYSYSGNRVTGISATTEALPFEGMTGLGKSGNYSLGYDDSGRLTRDSSRGITNIGYDNDGRVTNVKFNDMSEQQYEWDAMGNHVVTRFIGVSATGKPTTKKTLTYTGDGRFLENGVEKYAHFPGGYVQNGSYYWYSKDYQGNNITVLNESGTPVQDNDYYPYGEVWLEPEGQPWLYSGNERLREDGINEYDFNARRYNSALGLFTTWDPLAEKRPWDSPYSFCAGDPVNFSDPTGMVLNFSALLRFDEVSNLEISNKILQDLEMITGLQLYFDENNCLDYKMDSNRNPIINKLVKNSSENAGSKIARDLILRAIDEKNSIFVEVGSKCAFERSEGIEGIQGKIGLNYLQIERFINGAVGVDGNTMGFGMTFIHELCHSPLGGNLSDNKELFTTGSVVDKMNSIRGELNKKGFNFGKRMMYSAYKIGKVSFIAFDKDSYIKLQEDNDNLTGTSYIKF